MSSTSFLEEPEPPEPEPFEPEPLDGFLLEPEPPEPPEIDGDKLFEEWRDNHPEEWERQLAKHRMQREEKGEETEKIE